MNVKLISAGAGSGKTYRLTEEIVKKLREGVRPSGIMATTFTRKAAAELRERVRQRLIQEKLFQEAEDVSNALIGTVNGLGAKLLQRFSFEAGLSPNVEVMDEREGDIYFNLALSKLMYEERVNYIQNLAERLSLLPDEGGMFAMDNWKRDLKNLCTQARANNFKGQALKDSLEKSLKTFSAYVPAPDQQSLESHHKRLLSMLELILQDTDLEKDSTKKTKDAVESVRKFAQRLKSGKQLTWAEWLKLSTTLPAKKSVEIFADMNVYAADHIKFAAFQKDMNAYLTALFELTEDAVQEYDDFKKKRGFIDYIDMEAMLDKLLDREDIREVLREELELVIVDEFQDTSPLQLKLFLKLDELAGSSIWVGDPKQSIYGFRGADPILMKNLMEEIKVAPEDIQKYSYRSRQDVVDFTNVLFTRAFDQMPKDQVALIAKRKVNADDPSHEDDPEMQKALSNWHFPKLEGVSRFSNTKYVSQIVEKVVDTLNEAPTIFCKKTNTHRTLIAGDIGILCRTNKSCLLFAEELAKYGVKASISRGGLKDCREIRLVLACLFYLLDRSNSLSRAEIMFLRGKNSLKKILEDRLRFLKEGKSDWKDEWYGEDHWFKALDKIGSFSSELSIGELMSLIYEDLPIREVVERMDNAAQRLANLEQLFVFATRFESSYARLGKAATIDGFLLHLDELNYNEEDLQASSEQEDAVRLVTYHSSKGLEYPMVVLYDLHKVKKVSPFGVSVEQKAEEMDFRNILEGRWLRFFPNPYGRSYAKSRYFEAIEQSDLMARAINKDMTENARLLYVGVTRARDYLVVPSSEYNNSLSWLNQTFSERNDQKEEFLSVVVNSPVVWEGRLVPFVRQNIEETSLNLDSFDDQVSEEIYLYDKQFVNRNYVNEFKDITQVHFKEEMPLTTSVFSALPSSVLPELEETKAYFVFLERLLKSSILLESEESLIKMAKAAEPDYSESRIQSICELALEMKKHLFSDGSINRNVDYPVQINHEEQLVQFTVDILEDRAGEKRAYLFFKPASKESGQKKLMKTLAAKARLLNQIQIDCVFVNIAEFKVLNWPASQFMG